ncbi:MAG: DinB family protein [Saprospiraceae bacterium]|nr:DinB family protein [Saprospiraceae bacterium]
MTNAGFARTQYDLVRSARQVLLDYCATLSPEDFVRQAPGFGKGGSVRHLLVHNIHCYEHWIARRALQLDRSITVADTIKSVVDCRVVYAEMDILMATFLDQLEEKEDGLFTMTIRDRSMRVDGLKLFTHTITHEFHHKGQILTLSRQLGYTPVDTDIMR